MDDNQKPPTQSVGVAGFKADLYASDIKKTDWDTLIHLPKFQMFCGERSKQSINNVMEWIMGFIQDQCYKDAQVFFESYVKWHDEKGYWKNEDVYGQLIGE